MSLPATWISLLLLTACLGACSNEPVPVAVTSSCAVDSVEGATTTGATFAAKRDSALVVRGWAGDNRTGALPKRTSVVLVRQDGTLRTLGTGESNVPRPDVAKAFNQPGLLNAGIAVNVSLSGVPAGTYEIHLLQSYTGHQLACTANKLLKVG